MFLRSKRLALAVEWTWLLIGTAVVFVHLLEAWAQPYLPVVWMLGVLVLFVVYRVGMALREMYWPAPEPEEPAEAFAGGKRKGGDGMISTTEWVPPQIRGRKREMRAQQQQQRKEKQQKGKKQKGKKQKGKKQIEKQRQNRPAAKIELPGEDGEFEEAEVPTVFAQVDDETDPDSTMELDIQDNFSPTEIVDLRPETEADNTTGNLVIPSFAESTLTIRERQQTLDAMRRRQPGDSDETSELDKAGRDE